MRIVLIILLSLICLLETQAQPEYAFGDESVEDCIATLTDSDMGEEEDLYAHNEDYTFVVCPPGADVITITFSNFCTEPGEDVLSLYDGPNTDAPLITEYSGTISGPFSVPATSGCLTMHFATDGSIACTGWEAEWETEIELFPELEGLLVPDVDCYENQLVLQSDSPIACSSVDAGAFGIYLNGFPVEVTAADPQNCVDGFTQEIAVQTTEQLDQGGSYLMTFAYTYVDICGEEQNSDGDVSFNVVGCPLQVNIEIDPGVVCQGSCVDIFAFASGGDSDQYTYQWSPSLPPNEGPHEICPTQPTYSVTVTEALSGLTAEDTYIIDFLSAIDAGEDFTVCEQDDDVILQGSPPGGYWEGNMIADEIGVLDPDYDFLGDNWIYYFWNGCVDSLQVTLLEGWAGWNRGMCPGTGPHQLDAGDPAGGFWSGDFVTADGMFDPSEVGTHEVFYNAPNGCVDSRELFVAEPQMEEVPVLCQSDPPYLIQRNPMWGVSFSNNPGFENTWEGLFDPQEAGPGLHEITMTLTGGCSTSITIEVKELDLRDYWVPCPSQGVIALPTPDPAGGIWTTLSPNNSAADFDNLTFDAGHNNGGEFNENLVYSFGGCIDTMRVRVRWTQIETDYLEFCPGEEGFPFNKDNVGRQPGGGEWSGPGMVNPGNANSPFDPQLAGPGTHTIYYSRLGCTDSMTVVVHAPFPPEPIRVCDLQSPFNIPVDPPGGLFSGDGMLNVIEGTFDPGIGIGEYWIGYEFADGCYDEGLVIVEPVAQAVIDELNDFYCFSDTTISLSGNPEGGSFSGPGVEQGTFNPMMAGEGFHIIQYDYGEGECSSSDQLIVEVGAPISLNLTLEADSICFGEGTTLTAIPSGGVANDYVVNWQPDLGLGYTHYVSPEQTSTYSVSLSDGCTVSDPISVDVYVHPEIKYEVQLSEPVCAGEAGEATIAFPSGTDYGIDWQNPDLLDQPSISTHEGLYELIVEDQQSGCTLVDEIEIPAYDPVIASFDLDLVETGCYSRLDFNWIDKSQGGSSGTWDFGDGNTLPYIEGVYPEHVYTFPGDFTVSLYIENEGGCFDQYSQELCIRPRNSLSMPNAFSPNGDGVNDLFRPTLLGVTALEWQVFDRWGKLLFETQSLDKGWDGFLDGEVLPLGVYIYAGTFSDLWHEGSMKFQGNVTLVK